MIRTVVGSVAAVAALLTGGSAAVAVAPAPGPRQPAGYNGGAATPRARLTLTYMAEAGYAAAVKLTCNPAGGGHPEAAQACATLRTAGADPEKIKPARVMCMMLYAPITAEITGVWRGVPVEWTHKYGNSCEMTRATGVLFKF
jgi:hypothetical protein